MHLSDGYIGTLWWYCGGLEGDDLKDNPLHAWQKGFSNLDALFPADPGNWALVEDPPELEFKDCSGGVEFEVE